MGVIALTTLATLAVVAVALASAHEFNAKTTPITAEGTNHVFTAGEAIIKCEIARFQYSGAMGKFTKIAVVPSYEMCLVREQAASVTVEKAKFEFGVSKEIKANEFSLTSGIVGETGAQLKVTSKIEGEECEVIFPAQTIAGEATKFVNNSTKSGGNVKAKLEKVSFKSNSKCASLVPKEGTNGKYEGTATELGLIAE
jgi:hypothetical protein